MVDDEHDDEDDDDDDEQTGSQVLKMRLALSPEKSSRICSNP